MNNKGMVEYKGSLISKIRNFFAKLFNKQEIKPDIEQSTMEETLIEAEKPIQKGEFADELRVDTLNIDLMYEKEEFLKQIEGNKEALRQLSIDRLERLLQYYNEKIEENDKIIKKLKANA